MPARVRFVFLALIALAAAVAVTAAWFLIQNRPGDAQPQVGGTFSLVDKNGKAVTEADFRGKPLLLFFGFTQCPDVCPAALQLIADSFAAVPGLADKVTVALVSVDPERDTPEVMKPYVEYFDPRFQGLTGTPEQVAEVLKSFKVFARKRPLEDSAMGYTMDHSSFVYLYDAKGRFVTAFEPAGTPEDFAAKLMLAIPPP